jgi:VCBS repeat-containing protein
VVVGTISATDADGDDFTVTGPASTRKGTITYDSATDSFTYTPTQAAREAAAKLKAPASAKTDSFRVTIDDGHGGTQTITVKVDIAPPAAAPQDRPSINQVFMGAASYDFFQPGVDVDEGEGTWTPVRYGAFGQPDAVVLTAAPDARSALGNVSSTELAKYAYYIVAFEADPDDLAAGTPMFDAYHAVAAKELALGDTSYRVNDDQATHMDHLSMVYLWKKTDVPAAVKALPSTLPAPPSSST